MTVTPINAHLRARRQSRLPKSTQQTIRSLLAHAVLLFFGLSFILPFAWMVSTSLKSQEQIFVWPPQWIPGPFVWKNYVDAVTDVPFFLYLKNTLVIAVANVIGIMLSCPLVAYGLSRIKWPGRDLMFLLVLSTMMLPYEVTMIPLFMEFNKLGRDVCSTDRPGVLRRSVLHLPAAAVFHGNSARSV